MVSNVLICFSEMVRLIFTIAGYYLHDKHTIIISKPFQYKWYINKKKYKKIKKTKNSINNIYIILEYMYYNDNTDDVYA